MSPPRTLGRPAEEGVPYVVRERAGANATPKSRPAALLSSGWRRAAPPQVELVVVLGLLGDGLAPQLRLVELALPLLRVLEPAGVLAGGLGVGLLGGALLERRAQGVVPRDAERLRDPRQLLVGGLGHRGSG